jgi:hypothetical protein
LVFKLEGSDVLFAASDCQVPVFLVEGDGVDLSLVSGGHDHFDACEIVYDELVVH